MVMRAKNPGMWTAIGAVFGIVLGTALGNTPIGLALGAVAGVACAVIVARPRKPSC